MNKTHPHPSARHVMVTYRRFILGFKSKNKTARGVCVYRGLIDEYLRCKRDVIEASAGETVTQPSPMSQVSDFIGARSGI